MSDRPPVASETVLEEAPGRAIKFLRAIANNPVIYAQLAAAGFTPDDYQQGWHLLHVASGYTATPAAAPVKTPAFQAMQELDDWDEDGFRRIRAALERLHPEQEALVFGDGLAASTGPSSVVGVKKLLDRLDELESGESRKKTRKQDHAALATLAGRGFDKEERARLRGLVATAQTVSAPAEPAAVPNAAERRQALEALYLWFKDWSQTAHAVIKKRAHLITLGLAKRKSPRKSEEAAKPEAAKKNEE